jgi:plasmid stabilization system protein ParE
MEVRWSEAAAEDLERICEWIDRDDSEAARRVARTIYEQCGRLRDFPNLGRAGLRMAGRRELKFGRVPGAHLTHLPRPRRLAVYVEGDRTRAVFASHVLPVR